MLHKEIPNLEGDVFMRLNVGVSLLLFSAGTQHEQANGGSDEECFFHGDGFVVCDKDKCFLYTYPFFFQTGISRFTMML